MILIVRVLLLTVFSMSYALADNLLAADAEWESCMGYGDKSDAMMAFSSGDWEHAIKYATDEAKRCVSVLDPHEPALAARYLIMAKSQIKLKRYEEAVRSSDQCLDIDYKFLQCHLQKVIALKGSKQYARANVSKNIGITLCQKMLTYLPDEPVGPYDKEQEKYGTKFVDRIRNAEKRKDAHRILRELEETRIP